MNCLAQIVIQPLFCNLFHHPAFKTQGLTQSLVQQPLLVSPKDEIDTHSVFEVGDNSGEGRRGKENGTPDTLQSLGEGASLSFIEKQGLRQLGSTHTISQEAPCG